MTQVVVADFDTAALADMGVQDLEVARIPSAAIQRLRRPGDTKQRTTGHYRGCIMVKVTIDEMHAEAVLEILNRRGWVRVGWVTG